MHTDIDREKMICSILLLSLTSCICGPWAVTSYQAEENHNITLEWMFPTIISRPPDSYIIYCEMFTDERPSVLFVLHKGVEVPKSQDKHFRGRVYCDKDVLTEGRVRLQLCGLGTDDSGVYVCQAIINFDVTFSERRLNVSAAKDWNGHKGPDATGWWIGLSFGLGLPAAAAALLGVCCLLFIRHRRARRAQILRASDGFQKIPSGSVETVESVS